MKSLFSSSYVSDFYAEVISPVFSPESLKSSKVKWSFRKSGFESLVTSDSFLFFSNCILEYPWKENLLPWSFNTIRNVDCKNEGTVRVKPFHLEAFYNYFPFYHTIRQSSSMRKKNYSKEFKKEIICPNFDC